MDGEGIATREVSREVVPGWCGWLGATVGGSPRKGPRWPTSPRWAGGHKVRTAGVRRQGSEGGTEPGGAMWVVWYRNGSRRLCQHPPPRTDGVNRVWPALTL